MEAGIKKESKKMDIKRINTIRELKESGYKPRSIKQEIRENLIQKLQQKSVHCLKKVRQRAQARGTEHKQAKRI